MTKRRELDSTQDLAPSDGASSYDAFDEDDELVEDLRPARVAVRAGGPLHHSDLPDAHPPLDARAASAGDPFDPDDQDDIVTPPPIAVRPPPPSHDSSIDTVPMRRPKSPTELLVQRAVRPKSALEAARDAAAREAAPPVIARSPEPKVVPARPVTTPADVVRDAISRDLGGAGQIFVLEVQAIRPDDGNKPPERGTQSRSVLRALWRGHRAKFLADGNLERATTAAMVVHALEQPGELAVARVVARGRDHVAFIDLDHRAVVACLADAHALVMAEAPTRTVSEA